MKDLQVVEYSNQRILTTQQIAEVYGTTPQIVTNNFNRNKKRFTDGKHYYCLEGEDLKEFQKTNQFDLFSGEVNNRQSRFRLYLWTEKGAWLLAKSLNTDEAWQACEQLVDEYYRVKDQLAVALAALEKFGAIMEATSQGDVAAVTRAVDALDLSTLNALNTTMDILSYERQARFQPKPLDHPLSEESKEVLAVLDQAGHPASLKELTVALHKDEYDMLKTVFGMMCREEIKRVDDAYISLVLPEK